MWFLFLLCIGVIHSLCCYITFNEKYHERWWFIPIGLLLGLMSNGLWFLAAKTIGDKQNLYLFTFLWDSVVISIYFLLPLLFFSVKLEKMGFVGLFLIITGIILMKYKS